MADDSDPLHDEAANKTEVEGEKKGLFERTIPEIFKRAVERAVESGIDKLTEGPENIRQFVGDLKLPKELLNYFYVQIDETKHGLYRVVAQEIRDVLDRTHFAEEITKALTKLSFEIKTEIRFVPNEAAKESSEENGLPKPEITSQVTVKDRSKEAGSDRRREKK